MKKYKWRTGRELVAAEFTDFVQDFVAGELKPFLKSEAEPCA